MAKLKNKICKNDRSNGEGNVGKERGSGKKEHMINKNKERKKSLQFRK